MPDIDVCALGSINIDGYDDGTKETTLNITVGTSQVSTTEFRIYADADDCIGNPNLNNPIMVCVNGTAANLAYFNEIKPMGVQKSSYVPTTLTDSSSVKGCYVLPIPALKDGAADRRYWSIDPLSDPGVTVEVSVCVFDKDYYENDKSAYVPGFEDVSANAAATDVGIAITCKDMHFN
jgi:hypothetical protein